VGTGEFLVDSSSDDITEGSGRNDLTVELLILIDYRFGLEGYHVHLSKQINYGPQMMANRAWLGLGSIGANSCFGLYNVLMQEA